MMEIETVAEGIAAVVAVLVLLGGIGAMWASLVGKLTNHEVRISTGELIMQNTARIQERTAAQLAVLEERTKEL